MDTCRKTCSKCHMSYQQRIGRHGSICRSCKSARDRISRARVRNEAKRRHEKTPMGFLIRAYKNMQTRGQRHELPIMSKVEFYEWALIDPDFIALFDDWAATHWPRRLTPSLDRIVPTGGFVLGNVRWITLYGNSRLGGLKKVA